MSVYIYIYSQIQCSVEFEIFKIFALSRCYTKLNLIIIPLHWGQKTEWSVGCSMSLSDCCGCGSELSCVQPFYFF